MKRAVLKKNREQAEPAIVPVYEYLLSIIKKRKTAVATFRTKVLINHNNISYG